MADDKTGARVPTVIADDLHIVYRVNGARSGKGSATAALSRILKRGEERMDGPTDEVLREYEKFTGK